MSEDTKEIDRLPTLKDSLASAFGPENQTIMLAVFLPGTNYPEDVETRLRSRYAVVSALGISGYIPDYGGKLRCGRIDPSCTAWPSLKSAAFPFESYSFVNPEPAANSTEVGHVNLQRLTDIRRAGQAPRRVIVIWVDESLFDNENPATLLTDLVQRLPCRPRLQGQNLAILGPGESGTLRGLLSESRTGSSPPARSPKVKIYSSSSTVASLRKKQTGRMEEKKEPARVLDGGFEVTHVIGTDGDLAQALREELKLRGVEPVQDGPPIALVAEWDTFYSESLFDVFGNMFPDQAHFFTYQRGIDGRLPRDRPAGGNSQQGSGVLPGGEPLVSRPQVTSFGRSQIDYLPRLVEQMKERISQGESWAAIGVVGSDFYDKLLILETLKHEYPAALFFTTDLDARYLDPYVRRTAQNLLIASHYGLAVHKDLQRGVPPFRSVYQTSLFLGCLRALHDQGVPAPEPASSPRKAQVHPDQGKPGNPARSPDPKQEEEYPTGTALSGDLTRVNPMVFEVSRTGAFPLTDPGTEGVHPEAYAPRFARPGSCGGSDGDPLAGSGDLVALSLDFPARFRFDIPLARGRGGRFRHAGPGSRAV